MAMIVTTFILTTVLYGTLMVFAFRRVASHLQGNAEATKTVVEHVLIPLLGRKIEVAEPDDPEAE
jgi:hypothetical protein